MSDHGEKHLADMIEPQYRGQASPSTYEVLNPEKPMTIDIPFDGGWPEDDHDTELEGQANDE